jgi:hypothetical protein
VKRRAKSGRKTLLKPLPCGTPAGYEGHLRRREWPCGRCLFGSGTYTREEIGALIEKQYDRDRDQQLWNTYRLSLERVEVIFKRQGERCACCGATSPGDAPWHIDLDHDHETQQIRGVLCLKCNTGIDQLGDNLAGLLQAVAYLQAHQERGGHALAESPPKPRETPPASALMQRCFKLFQQGVSKSQAVSILRLEPSLVGHLYDVWLDEYREKLPPSPDQHIFQIGRDPFRCMCSCGFTIDCDEKDTETVRAATVAVNDHVKTSNGRKVDWLALKVEEDARRKKEALLQKEAERQRALEDIRVREAQRLQKQQDLQLRNEQREERRQFQETKRLWKDYGKG